MKRVMFVLTLAGLAILASATNVFALENHKFTETATIEIGDAPDVSIETLSGDIKYTGVEGMSARVTALVEVRADSEEEAQRIREGLEVRMEGETGLLDLYLKHDKDYYEWIRDEFGSGRWISVSFTVEGPRGAAGELTSVSGGVMLRNTTGGIHVSTVSGDVDVANVRGRMRVATTSGQVTVDGTADFTEAKSVSGDVNVYNCGSSLFASSVSGGVYVDGAEGAVEVGSVSGDVRLLRVDGSVTAKTTSGSIEAENVDGDMALETTSGDIVAATSDPAARIDAHSMSGTVEIGIPRNAGGTVRLSTFSGSIESDRDIRVREKSSRTLWGTIGEGTGEIEVETFSGDIVLSVR